MTLRALLIQRAARLQERPAFTAPGWGTLPYPAFRNRVEGVALGIMAGEPPMGTRIFSATGGPLGLGLRGRLRVLRAGMGSGGRPGSSRGAGRAAVQRRRRTPGLP